MKKSILFIACCIGLLFFASCKKDPIAPSINITNGSGYVTENAQVYSGDEVYVGFTCTGENLTKIDIVLSQDGTVLASYSDDLNGQKNDPVSSYICKHNFVIRTSGTVTVTGTVTDASGQTASKSFNIHYDEKPNAKFLGDYEGNALFSGTMEASIVGMEPMQEEITDHETPIDQRSGEVEAHGHGGRNAESVHVIVKGVRDIGQLDDDFIAFHDSGSR